MHHSPTLASIKKNFVTIKSPIYQCVGVEACRVLETTPNKQFGKFDKVKSKLKCRGLIFFLKIAG